MSPVTRSEYCDKSTAVIDVVEDAVAADSDTQTGLSEQLLGATWSGISGEGLDSLHQAFRVHGGNAAEFAYHAYIHADFIGAFHVYLNTLRRSSSVETKSLADSQAAV